MQQDLATCFYEALQVECFGVNRTRLNWSIQIKKGGILVSSVRVLSKRHTRQRSWEAGESVYHEGA